MASFADINESTIAPKPSEVLKTMFKFHVPHPTAVSLESYFGDGAPDATRMALNEGSASRAEMVESMKGREPEPNALRSHAADYLRYICRVVATERKIEADEYCHIKPTTKFVWTSVLDKRARTSQWSQTGAYFDAIFTMACLGFAHCNSAYDATHGTMEDLKSSSKHLRSAAGVFASLASELIAPHKGKFLPSKPHPLEVHEQTMNALACATLAQAQQLMLYTAEVEQKGKALLAKLAKGISDKYKEALSFLVDGLPSAQLEQVDLVLMETMTVMADAALAIAYKYNAIDQYDKGEYGMAVAYAGKGKDMMNGMTGKIAHAPLKAVVSSEADYMNRLHGQYEMENNTIFFMPIPKASQVPPLKAIWFVKPEAYEMDSKAGEALELPEKKEDTPPPPPPSDSKTDDSKDGDVETVYVDAKKPLKPAGSKQMKFCCACCGQAMTAPAGSPSVQCPKCTAINMNIVCGACDGSVSFASGNKLVRCPMCNVVNRLKA